MNKINTINTTTTTTAAMDVARNYADGVVEKPVLLPKRIPKPLNFGILLGTSQQYLQDTRDSSVLSAAVIAHAMASESAHSRFEFVANAINKNNGDLLAAIRNDDVPKSTLSIPFTISGDLVAELKPAK